MKHEVIMKLKAGRALNALVAERVMGLTADKKHCPYCGSEMWIGALRSRCSSCSEWRYGWYKNYSDDIAAAWEVIERIREIDEYWCPDIHWDDDDGEGNPMWVVSFNYFGEDESQFKVAEAQDKSAPLAICRAALIAVTS
jgi:hypothetical protein